MNTKNQFIFTDFIRNDSNFTEFELFPVNEHLNLGSFKFDNLNYTFSEAINEEIILFSINLKIETNIKKSSADINKSISEINEIYTNVKISLDDLNDKNKTATFTLSCATLVENSINNPGVIINPAVNVLPITFTALKEKI